jgi:disulfide bond formation protein DsbB
VLNRLIYVSSHPLIFDGLCALELLEHFPACILCHVERWIFLAGGIASFFAGLWWPRFSSKLACGVACFTWLGGSAVALYHSAIQFHLLPLPHFCTIQEADSLDSFLKTSSISCDQRSLELFGIPVPLYLAALFTVYALLCLRMMRKKS